MPNVEISLKDGNALIVENLVAINVSSGQGSPITVKDFRTISLSADESYIFYNDETAIAIHGESIHYLTFSLK